jgi:hypothetical protein
MRFLMRGYAYGVLGKGLGHKLPVSGVHRGNVCVRSPLDGRDVVRRQGAHDSTIRRAISSVSPNPLEQVGDPRQELAERNVGARGVLRAAAVELRAELDDLGPL